LHVFVLVLLVVGGWNAGLYMVLVSQVGTAYSGSTCRSEIAYTQY